jgi:hypothetical protein
MKRLVDRVLLRLRERPRESIAVRIAEFNMKRIAGRILVRLRGRDRECVCLNIIHEFSRTFCLNRWTPGSAVATAHVPQQRCCSVRERHWGPVASTSTTLHLNDGGQLFFFFGLMAARAGAPMDRAASAPPCSGQLRGNEGRDQLFLY